jgi:hypothetical protein
LLKEGWTANLNKDAMRRTFNLMMVLWQIRRHLQVMLFLKQQSFQTSLQKREHREMNFVPPEFILALLLFIHHQHQLQHHHHTFKQQMV